MSSGKPPEISSEDAITGEFSKIRKIFQDIPKAAPLRKSKTSSGQSLGLLLVIIVGNSSEFLSFL